MEVTAAVADGQGEYSIETIDIAHPHVGEVLVAMRASGICHTDWDSLRWGRPLILGHEGAGEVLAAGEGVTSCRAGDRVMLNWAIPCGVCFQCKRQKPNICEDRGTVPDQRYRRTVKAGMSADPMPTRGSARSTGRAGPGHFNASFSLGTMATHALVPQAAVLALPSDVPFEIGAIMGCAVMTGFGSAVNAAQITKGSSVVVLGCGGVGLSTIQGAVHCGATQIIAIDTNPLRLDLAVKFGATRTLLADRSDKGLRAAARTIREWTSGRGADYAFECTAIPALGSAPLAMVRSGGTAVGVSGIEQIVPIDMELFEWDKLYLNPLYGGCEPQRDFPMMLGLYQQGKLPLDAMVTRRYSLSELPSAFEDMLAGRIAKGVLLFD